MGFLSDIAKIALPAVASSFMPGVGSALFSGATGVMANPAVQQGLLSGGLGLLMGQKPKDALKSALLGGIGQTMFGGQAAAQAAGQAKAPSIIDAGKYSQKAAMRQASEQAAKTAALTGTGGTAAEPIAAKTMSAELLKGIGAAGEGEGNLLYKLLNTQLGEGLAAGLVAQLLAGGDDDEDNRSSWERRPYAGGLNYGRMGGINYATGGDVYYPRRDGGINPSEGSGTEDDVPAMLTAGEFVMTRDAVKGAGGGDLNQGINRMYNMMDKFERMA